LHALLEVRRKGPVAGTARTDLQLQAALLWFGVQQQQAQQVAADPGVCYLFIGNGAAGTPGGACMVHNPGYDFNDDNIAVGAAYWVLLAKRFLSTSSSD
jgi:metal-dependent amidase/aminoacylase/carboxypeptidase family protein